MRISDLITFERHRQADSSFGEVLLVMLVFASVGAIAWAIRGTSGWGGIDGTFVPGLFWGVLWWYVCWRKGINARGVVLWLGLGVSLGGELGYGQYVSWIQGKFYVGDEIVAIEPWNGWLWFAMCGIGWAAPGGVALGWALAGRRSLGCWLARIVVPVGGGLLTRLALQKWPWLMLPNWELDYYIAESDGVIDQVSDIATQWKMLGAWLVCVVLCGLATGYSKHAGGLARGVAVAAVCAAMAILLVVSQWLFFPEDQLCLFAGELGNHLGRTVYTQSQNAIVVGWWLGALIVAFAQRDRFTKFAGAVLGIGFGVLFPVSAAWCLGYAHSPKLIDWWKLWELNSGFFLGPLYVVVLYWAIRQVDEDQDTGVRQTKSTFELWGRAVAEACGVFLILYVAAREEFLVVGILLGCFFAIPQLLSLRSEKDLEDRQRALSFLFAVFLLVFHMAWGMSSQAGILLGLYDADAADQYAWPTGRVILFAPLGFLIAIVAMRKMWQVCGYPRVGLPSSNVASLVSMRMIDLMTFLGVVGAVSIWPAKIGAFYAVFLGVAIYSFNRLNLVIKT